MERIPLELYIHIPFCVKKCDYCDFLSFPCGADVQEAYVEALTRELKLYASEMDEYEIISVFFGGGTPSILNEESITNIMDTIRSRFHMDRNAEVTIECNPGTLTQKKLFCYIDVGINRLSLGLQSADNKELALLGRIHSWEEFLEAYRMARMAGFTNINVDLISGIPFQTAEKFDETLKKVVALCPEHLSVYSLIVEEGTPFYERYREDMELQKMGKPTQYLPTEEEEYRITKSAQAMLAKYGYGQYEISNFARPGYECRHNMGYWTGISYLGVGLGASSLVADVRYTNTTDINAYFQAAVTPEFAYESWLMDASEGDFHQHADINGYAADRVALFETNFHASMTPLTFYDKMEEFMFLGLRMNCGVSLDEFQRRFGLPLEEAYASQINDLLIERLIQFNQGRMYLNERGMEVANYCMAKFLH